MARFFDFSHLRGDIFGGLTAGVVALPLALAFGEASGAGPIAGVYGAILVGFFAALFGGTPSQISGPTGPMIVVFAGVFASLSGDLSLVFATVILAGAIQILFGVLGFGQYIRLVPYPVVSFRINLNYRTKFCNISSPFFNNVLINYVFFSVILRLS